ncbi:MAG: T9SS type A sorting domain-containing protein [Paludibacter sp.]|jgi:hypothetical protein|nr:T9SS type A sorting domain-containing protein [Paludibacter sp.]
MNKITVLLLAVLVTVTAANAQLSGGGTAQDPYLISSVNDLKFLRDQVNLTTNTSELNTSVYQQAGKIFRLTTDIDLVSEEWIPIGNFNNAFRSFRGIFDGNGHKIQNLKIGSVTSRAAFVQAGLFAYCTNNAILKNITIENAAVYNGTVASLNQTAILVANANLTTIHNCHVSGVADCLHTSKGVQVGGIVANGIDITLINSSANVTINAESTVNTGTQIAVNSGGLVSVLAVSATGSIIKNCFSKGSIIATSAMPSGTGNFVYAGGIVANSAAGNATYQNKIINCYSSCNLTSTSTGTVISYAGGIAGSNGNYGTISNCIALNPSITFNSGATTKSANRITGNNAATSTVLADNYASEGMTISAYTPTSNITGKDGADLGVNVPATLMNSILSNLAAIKTGTEIYLFKPWITSFGQPVFGSGLEVNVSNIDDCPGCNVSIPSETSLNVNAVRTYNSIILSPGAKLSINSAMTLTATNGITLQSDATGTATLLNSGTYIGTVTTQQYLGSARNWYVSSPVSSATAPATNVDYYYEYVEAGDNDPTGQPGSSTAYWKGLANGSPMAVGKGYIAKATAGTTISFSGTPNNGNITTDFDLTRNESAGKGFNLAGNPYPSYIDWTDVAAANPNLENTYYYRTKNTIDGYTFVTYNGAGSGSYVVGNGTANTTITRFIPPTQAFWVRVKSGTSATKMYFNNDMREHRDDSGNLMKAPRQDTRPSIRLQLHNCTQSDELLIYQDAGASNNYDSYDSPKMMNNSTSVPDLYSIAGDEQVVINGLNTITENMEIPLGFSLKSAAALTIKTSELNNLPEGMNVYLLDKSANTQTQLTTETEYSFTTNEATTNNESRFSLVFKSPGITTVDNASEFSQQTVFVNAQNELVIIAPENTSYAIFTMVGELVKAGKVTENTVRVNAVSKGVYLVKVNNHTSKVIIR